MLDARSPVPLYQQLADDIRGRIVAGEYQSGDRIPSEHELASRYSLGRPTVRQATEVLVRRGMLERRRGAGTFVAEKPTEVDLFSLGGTLASFERSGVSLQTRVTRKLALRRVRSDESNPFSGSTAYCLDRLGLVDRRAVLLERIYFSPATFPALSERAPDAGSLSRAIATHYALEPEGGRQTFVVQPAGDAARLLGIAADAPVLLVRRTLDFPGAPAALFAELHCLTGEFVFAQNLVPAH